MNDKMLKYSVSKFYFGMALSCFFIVTWTLIFPILPNSSMKFNLIPTTIGIVSIILGIYSFSKIDFKQF